MPLVANPHPSSGVSSRADASTVNQSGKPSKGFQPFPSYGFNSRVYTSNQTRRKEPRSASETAIYRCQSGLKVAELLEESAHYLESADAAAEAIAISDCMRESSSPQNLYFSVNQKNSKTGEKSNRYGCLSVAVGSRLDANYEAKQSTRNKRKVLEKLTARQIIDARGQLLINPEGNLLFAARGNRLRFLTFTSPNLACNEEIDLLIQKRAMELFKKREVWINAVDSAFINLELTEGKAEIIHTHWHNHALAVSKWIDQELFAFEWTSCFEIAAAEYGVKYKAERNLVFWVNDVVEYVKNKQRDGKKGEQISFQKAILEISKYFCKSSSILKFPVEKIAKLERIFRGRKFFQTYGNFNECKGTSKRANLPVEPSIYKRTQMTASETKPTLRIKQTLVRIGTRMILEGRREEWRMLLHKKESLRRAFRQRQLAELYPEAIFFTLGGRKFASSDFVHGEKPNVKSFISVY